ncbi:MAG: ATP-binding protein [Casimicrobiaceae bacterium]
MFDPFRSGALHGGGKSGLGLGLYIVQQIVQAHEGLVTVQCLDGQRTSFDVTLPRSTSMRVDSPVALLRGDYGTVDIAEAAGKRKS